MLDVIIKAAENAGIVSRKYFKREALDISQKTSHHDIVTEADIESQQVIHQTILEEIKKRNISEDEIGFIGEENLRKVGKHTFVIDPIDGTSNFATGIDEFAVIIGYFNNGELAAGVMYFPVKGVWLIAEKGKGSYIIKNQVKAPLQAMGTELQNTFLFSSISYAHDLNAKVDQRILKLKKLFRGVRMFGSAASEISYLAENISGCTLIAGCSIWDISAGKLILDEAGFGMYDFEGKEITFELEKPDRKYPFFACHPKYKELIYKDLLI